MCLDNICKNENNMFLNFKLSSEVLWSLMKQPICFPCCRSHSSSSITAMFFSLHPQAKSRLESLNAATAISWLQFRYAIWTLSHVDVASAGVSSAADVPAIEHSLWKALLWLLGGLLHMSSFEYTQTHAVGRTQVVVGARMQIHLLECECFTR